MTDLLQLLAGLSVVTFVVGCMLTMGLSLTVRALAAPLRRVRLVVLALIANFVVAPAAAYLLTKALPLREAHALGLLLLGAAAGAPFLPKLVELARGDLALSVALTLLLTAGTVLFMPLALPLLLPGAQVSAWSIAQPILLQLALPLAVGLSIRARSERLAARLEPALRLVTNISMVLLLVLLIGLNGRAMLATFGSGAVAASVLFVALCLALGYVLGGPGGDTPRVLGLGTAQRNIAAALVTATSSFPDPEVVVMLLVTTVLGLILLSAASLFFRNHSEGLLRTES
jgi:BASS family bile acid:Na+ symporter